METIAEMNTLTGLKVDNWNQNGSVHAPIRVVRVGDGAKRLSVEKGQGWRSEVYRADGSPGKQDGQDAHVADVDCWLVETDALALETLTMLEMSGLPIVVVADAATAGAVADLRLIDMADAFLFAEDDPATVATVFGAVTSSAPAYGVRDLSDGTARTINALSAEAGRIANALARLADDQRDAPLPTQSVGATMIRRQIRMRRERERFFPAEIFGDPAWDMLLDLMAAQLEGRKVPVSSLCIAASVPTTTALRWIRSLTEAGLFVRRIDPEDARRAHVSLSAEAATAMLGWLRLFGDNFAPR